MALICYQVCLFSSFTKLLVIIMAGLFFPLQDGFVLVGSVAGQRYWSTLLPPSDIDGDTGSVTSGAWTPDDQHVYLGTSNGSVLVMDISGNTVGSVKLR